MDRACPICGIDLSGRRWGAIYCSRRCKVRASDMRRRVDGRAHLRDRARYRREAEHRRAYAKAVSRALREVVIAHYGGVCRRCGSRERLELDHVHGNGKEHRERVGRGDRLYRWILRNRFPPECEPGGKYELQVLCRACHLEKTRSERRVKAGRR
jgi:hypothetical protein